VIKEKRGYVPKSRPDRKYPTEAQRASTRKNRTGRISINKRMFQGEEVDYRRISRRKGREGIEHIASVEQGRKKRYP